MTGTPPPTGVTQYVVTDAPDFPDHGLVWYVGSSDVRIISRSDWEKVGVEQEDVVWNADNQFTVPVGSLSPDTLPFLTPDEFLFTWEVLDVETKG
jgi:hypothetical protein